MFWTHEVATDQDLPVHWAISEDGGKTWSQPRPTNIQGQVTYPVHLGGQRLLAVYNRRYHDRPGIMAVLSENEGKTWDVDNQVVVWDAVGQSDTDVAAGDRELERHLKIQFGAPTAQLLSDGDVLVTFWCTQAGVTHSRWCRLRVAGS